MQSPQRIDQSQASPQPQAFSRMDRSFLGTWWWTIDRASLGCVMLLLALGVALVATASPSVAQTIGAEDLHFLKKHLFFLFPSIITIFAISMFSPRYIWRSASIILLVTFVMMILVLVTGPEIKGAKRWLSILGFSIQPSEFLKPSFIVVAAWFISLQKKSMQHNHTYLGDEREKLIFPGYHIAIVGYFVFLALLLMQPDLGMSVVLTMIFAIQIFLAGMRFRYLAVLFAIGSAGLGIAYLTFYHVRSRIDRFIFPDSGDNYQVERSLEAIKKGGFLGVGPGQGNEKMTVPDSHADFIFSVMVEEMGLIFSMALILIFLFIIMRGFSRLQNTKDIFPVLAAGGLLSMFGIQSIIHIGSAVNLLPAKGMTPAIYQLWWLINVVDVHIDGHGLGFNASAW